MLRWPIESSDNLSSSNSDLWQGCVVFFFCFLLSSHVFFSLPLPVSPNTYRRRANGRAPLSLAGDSLIVGRRASCRALQCLDQTETAPRLSPADCWGLLVWFAQSISMLNSSTQQSTPQALSRSRRRPHTGIELVVCNAECPIGVCTRFLSISVLFNLNPTHNCLLSKQNCLDLRAVWISWTNG